MPEGVLTDFMFKSEQSEVDVAEAKLIDEEAPPGGSCLFDEELLSEDVLSDFSNVCLTNFMFPRERSEVVEAEAKLIDGEVPPEGFCIPAKDFLSEDVVAEAELIDGEVPPEGFCIPAKEFLSEDVGVWLVFTPAPERSPT